MKSVCVCSRVRVCVHVVCVCSFCIIERCDSCGGIKNRENTETLSPGRDHRPQAGFTC